MNPYQKMIMDEFGIPAEAFFRHCSDMYVGCHDLETAVKIRDGGPWNSMATLFRPNKGSDMGHFYIAVDIPLAYMHEHIESKKRGAS